MIREAGESGCVELRLTGTKTGELLNAVATLCERLVRGKLVEPALRARLARLNGLIVVAPLAVAAPASIVLPPSLGSVGTIAFLGGIFIWAALSYGLLAVLRRTVVAEMSMLVGGTVALASIVAACGGAGSPAALILSALPFEAWWVGRSRKAAVFGTCAVGVALALQYGMSSNLPFDGSMPSAAQWLIPIAYLALVVPRLALALEARQGAVEATRLEDIVEAVVLRTDLAGEVTAASAQARNVMGLAPELLLSTGVFDRMHVADRVAYLCGLADLRSTPGMRRVFARMRVPGSAGHSSGDYRPFVIEMMRRAARDTGITMLLRARDDAAEEGSSGRAGTSGETFDLASARKMAAVSHELRTPLNSIIGFSDMLLQEMLGGFADPRQKEYVGLVRDSGVHLLSVVNSMLDLSRMNAGAQSCNPETFRLSEVVESCRSMMARQASERRIEVKTEVPARIGDVHADKLAVKQILINLVSNAVKFTPEGGVVSIGAKRLEGRVYFWVSDTGIGIPAEDLARIGEPFVQVRNDYTTSSGGTGLGLSLVRGLVALNRGTMSIESEPGQGTTVTISLPVDQQGQSARDSAEIFEMVESRSKETHDGPFRKTA